jgi:hypothetical protein
MPVPGAGQPKSNWSDHDILPGEFWRHEIDEALKKLNSDYCFYRRSF